MSPWGPWSECSRSCGRNSRRFRRRTCTRQESCSGDPDDEEEDCSFISCPSWSRWSKCSVTCGGGMKLRTRVCRGIENCDDEDIFQRPCNRRACRTPVNCNWCPWTNGNGLQPTRVRIPNCPAQSNGGAPCRGKAQKIPFNKCDPRNTIQDLGTIYSLDYHRGPDWYKNRFDVTCPGGCFEIIKVDIFDNLLYLVFCDPLFVVSDSQRAMVISLFFLQTNPSVHCRSSAINK